MATSVDYSATSPSFTYDCPTSVDVEDIWTTFEQDAVGKELKSTKGAGCTAMSQYTGTVFEIGGGIGSYGATWGCKIDDSEFTWYTASGGTDWSSAVLHSITVSNSPEGGQLVIANFKASAADTDLLTFQDVSFSTIAKPASATRTSSSSLITSTAAAASTEAALSTAASFSTALSTSISLSSTGSSSSSGSATTLAMPSNEAQARDGRGRTNDETDGEG
ncbi:hypothetical protein JCM10213_006757 [Rhodosporidiobolus nylandii]